MQLPQVIKELGVRVLPISRISSCAPPTVSRTLLCLHTYRHKGGQSLHSVEYALLWRNSDQRDVQWQNRSSFIKFAGLICWLSHHDRRAVASCRCCSYRGLSCYFCTDSQKLMRAGPASDNRREKDWTREEIYRAPGETHRQFRDTARSVRKEDHKRCREERQGGSEKGRSNKKAQAIKIRGRFLT